MDSVVGIKRLNPETGLTFKCGDQDYRGFYFRNYLYKKIIDGYYGEHWLSPNAYKNLIEYRKNIRKITKEKIKNGFIGKKRINPITNKPFVSGDMNKLGYFFVSYDYGLIDQNGFYYENWGKDILTFKLTGTLARIKKRAKIKKIDFDLDIKYLKKIFPKDYICPIFKIKMEFDKKSKNTFNSITLDRIIPKLGYIKGNVVFICRKANTIKNDGNSDQILAVGNWLKEMEKRNG